MEKVIFILIFLFCALALTLYILYRNNKVCAFHLKVIDLMSLYQKKEIRETGVFTRFIFYDKLPSYDKMLYSFKKLKLESYYTNKEIKELLGK